MFAHCFFHFFRYNDIQCGNGPPNDAGDETECPGRIEYGAEGCKYIGPLWDFSGVDPGEPDAPEDTEAPTSAPSGDESGDRPNSIIFDAFVTLWLALWGLLLSLLDS